MSPSVLHKWLWHLIHFLIALYTCIYKGYSWIKTKLFELKPEYNETTSVLKEISRHVGELKKVPSHLTVLVGGSECSYKDWAQLILWSAVSGVSFVSFFDTEGRLKDEQFRKTVDAELTAYHVVWHDGENGYRNGFKGRKVNVKVIGPEDGRQTLVTLSAKSIGRTDVGGMDRLVRERDSFPDPELALYTGEHLNLRGYPPWQIRLTEFLNLNVNDGVVSPVDFVRALRRYNQCEQRVGK